MSTRAILTTIWIGAFLLAVVIAESYFYRTTATGIPFLLPSDRVTVCKMLALIYAANIGAVLASWFIKPFHAPKRPAATRFVTALALILTVAYNLILLYLIGQGHLSQTDTIDIILDRVKLIAGVLAFLTIPVNSYYFGMPEDKSKKITERAS